MTRSLDMLEAIAKAATPGRWQWYGNTKNQEVYLSTVTGGRVYVMDFVRWGMTLAQPRFQIRDPRDGGVGYMRSVGELGAEEHPQGPKFEVSYRRQFQGIGHPDATHIAENDPTTTLVLIARIRELEAGLLAAANYAENLSDDVDADTARRLHKPFIPEPNERVTEMRQLVSKGVVL
jgi:hypothetical protein